jgi:uncharacterized membrane protein
VEGVMGAKKFTINGAVGYGWNAMKANIGILLIYTIVTFVVIGGLNGAQRVTVGEGFSFSFSIVNLIVNSIVGIVGIKIALNIFDGKGTSLEEIGLNLKLLLNYIGGYLLYMIIVVLGVLLFIVPGVIWGIKYSFMFYIMIDQNVGPTKALEMSGQMTDGIKMDLFVLYLVFILITIAGFLALFVGIFVAIPVLMMAQVYVYRQMSEYRDPMMNEAIEGEIIE